jgi:ribonuclease HI
MANNISKNRKYYVVWKGRKAGIFDSWNECLEQVKGFKDAEYKSFKTLRLAEEAFRSKSSQFIGKELFESDLSGQNFGIYGKPISDSIVADAACSNNPGVLEYRAVNFKDKKEIFRKGPFPEGTINLGEFLAIVDAIRYLKKIKKDLPIYSDSDTAITWVKNRQIKTQLERSNKNEKLFNLVDQAINYLRTNSYNNKITKWQTQVWGENPADFGRK